MEKLYIGKCRRCGYLVHAHTTNAISWSGREVTVAHATPDLKTKMTEHLNHSHREGIDYALQVSMKDYKAFFQITTIRNTPEEPNAVQSILSVINNRGFWVAIRSYPKLENTLFSGLGNGEFKLFLKSERD